MAPAERAVAAVLLSLLCLFRAIFSSEYFSSLTLFNNELSKQGCSSLSDWEEYAADCGKVSVFCCCFATSSRYSRLAFPPRANDKRLIRSRDRPPEMSCCRRPGGQVGRRAARLRNQMGEKARRFFRNCSVCHAQLKLYGVYTSLCTECVCVCVSHTLPADVGGFFGSSFPLTGVHELGTGTNPPLHLRLNVAPLISFTILSQWDGVNQSCHSLTLIGLIATL